MKILAVFDEKNYDDTVEVFEKYAVRGIIVQNGRLAMQCSKYGEYKIPGGGREEGETLLQTLAREISEETGLIIIEDQVVPLGEITEIHRDIFDEKKKYICHLFFFYCKVKDEMTKTNLTPSEIERGYELGWKSPEEICENNKAFFDKSWIKRDTAFIEMLINGQVVLPEKIGGNLCSK